jgi:hypothetical protein
LGIGFLWQIFFGGACDGFSWVYYLTYLLVYLAVSLAKGFWRIFLVDVFVTNTRCVVFADFLVDFFCQGILGLWCVRIFLVDVFCQISYRRVVIADFLGGWFGSFSWCMLVFSMCFQPIFLVDIFLSDFLDGSFLTDFLVIFAKFDGVFAGFFSEWFWWIVKMDYLNWMVFMNRMLC